MPAGIVVPPLLLVDSSRPFERFDLRLSGLPASSLRHSISGFSPSAPAAESNCRMTSDSRFCKGSSSSPFQTPRSIAHPALPPLDCSLPLNRLPRLPIVKYKMVLLHPSGSSPCRLTRPMSLHLHTPPSLRRLSPTSSLLRGVPPLGAAFILSPLWFMPLVASPLTSAPKVPMFRIIASPEIKPTICRIPFRP